MKRARANIAGAKGAHAIPELWTAKLLKYGGNPAKLTPAQARRLRKAERKSRG